MLKIFIPSAGRHNEDEIMRGPLADFSEAWQKQTMYVVPESQLDAYRDALGKCFPHVSIVGSPAKGIAETRYEIGGMCRYLEIEKFAMVDDDVRFVRRITDDHTALKPCDHADVAKMWTTVDWFLNHYAHVGISARQGHNNMGFGGASTLFEENTRTLRVLCYRTEEFLSVQHGRVTVMEDFDVNLQLLRAGHKNANLGWWSQDQKMTNAPGGCSTYRTHEKHEESAKKLAEFHHPYVTLRQKQNKTGGEFGTRTEVTIFWKKAFRRG